MQKRTLYTAIGFVFFILGALSLLINMVGLDFGFLFFLDYLGKLGSFLFKLGFILVGILIVAFANADENRYDEYFDGEKEA
jgi:hypothetical protein